MGRMLWGTYLWPGLSPLCRHGSWSALGVAVGFAALLNLAITTSLVWTELAAPGVRNGVWVVVAVFWVASAAWAFRGDRRHAPGRKGDSHQDPMAPALDHYLKGNWFEAERILDRLLARNPRDLEAGLMLATMFRHTGRYEEAAGHLDRIERFDGCQKWELEIRRERELLNATRGRGSK